MRYRAVVLFSVLVCVYCQQRPEEELVKRVVKKCIESKARMACFFDKTAKALESATNWNISIFDGIELVRNNMQLSNSSQSRGHQSGFNRLIESLKNFLNTHTLSVDLTEFQPRGKGDDVVTLGFGTKNKKALKKEKKYMQYAFMVLLGIFGLTGPLIMKTLAIMAAKALIASKVALIIVGSVALKKIFEKDHHEGSSVKVHTITADDDDHDRIYKFSTVGPYWAHEPYSKPV